MERPERLARSARPTCAGKLFWNRSITNDQDGRSTTGRREKIFSNRWKTGENFFQSLEKMAQVFQPLENIFPIIGKFPRGGGASGLEGNPGQKGMDIGGRRG